MIAAFPHRMIWLAALFIGLLMLFAMPHQARAQSIPSSPASTASVQTIDAGGNRVTCSSFNDAKGALMGKIIPCLARTIEDATTRMAAEMSSFMRPTMFAFITLVIIFQGVMALKGERFTGPSTFLLILKIGLVIMFANSLGGYIPDVFAVMRAGEDIMAGALIPDAQNSGFHCDFWNYLPSDRPGHLLWAEFDCTLGKIMGFAVGDASTGKPSMILAASTLGLLGGFFFGGTFGFAVFFTAIGFIWSLLAFVVRSGFAYANAYLMAALYILISPIFIPLALLKVTTQYFQNWLRGFMAALILPVIVTAYAIFALLVFDNLLFKDGSDGGEKSVLYQLLDYEQIKQAQRHAKTTNLGTLLNDQQALAEFRELEGQDGAGALVTKDRDVNNPALFGANKVQIQMPNFEMERTRLEGLDETALDFEKKAYTKLLIDFAKLFVLGLIILQGWKDIMGKIVVLTGSGAASQTISAVSRQERNFQSAIQNARAQADGVMRAPGDAPGDVSTPSGVAGTAFIERLPGALQAGAGAFLGGISR
jgi:type IV secretory pathway VirB6-like protein